MDSAKSRLKAIKAIHWCKEKIEKSLQDGTKIKAVIDELDYDINQLINQVSKRENLIQEIQSDVEILGFEVRSTRRELQTLEESLKVSETLLDDQRMVELQLRERLDALTVELKSEFLSELSIIEKSEMQESIEQVTNLRSQFLTLTKARAEVKFSLSLSLQQFLMLEFLR